MKGKCQVYGVYYFLVGLDLVICYVNVFLLIFNCFICDSRVVCLSFRCCVVFFGLVIMLLVFFSMCIISWYLFLFFLVFLVVIGEVLGVMVVIFGSDSCSILLCVSSMVCLMIFFSLWMFFGYFMLLSVCSVLVGMLLILCFIWWVILKVNVLISSGIFFGCLCNGGSWIGKIFSW